MSKDTRDLLEVLKSELNYLEKGRYRLSLQTGRSGFIFEDSPTCFNYGCFDYDCREDPKPCTDCVLMQLVPPEHRAEKKPCRHIPLCASGETLDSLYRSGDASHIEEAVRNWLRATIERLEEGRKREP